MVTPGIMALTHGFLIQVLPLQPLPKDVLQMEVQGEPVGLPIRVGPEVLQQVQLEIRKMPEAAAVTTISPMVVVELVAEALEVLMGQVAKVANT